MRKNLILFSIASLSGVAVWYLGKKTHSVLTAKNNPRITGIPQEPAKREFEGMNLLMFYIHPHTGQMVKIESDPRKFDT